MDWPFLSQRELVTIHTLSPECLGPVYQAFGQLATNGFTGLTQNRAYFTPFRVGQAILGAQLFLYNGNVTTGKVDLGVYAEDGTKIVSTGSVSQVGSQVVQAFDVPDFTLRPGRFYLAFAGDANHAIARTGINSAYKAYFGMLIQSSAFPLPQIATFASISSEAANVAPILGLTGKALI